MGGKEGVCSASSLWTDGRFLGASTHGPRGEAGLEAELHGRGVPAAGVLQEVVGRGGVAVALLLPRVDVGRGGGGGRIARHGGLLPLAEAPLGPPLVRGAAVLLLVERQPRGARVVHKALDRRLRQGARGVWQGAVRVLDAGGRGVGLEGARP